MKKLPQVFTGGDGNGGAEVEDDLLQVRRSVTLEAADGFGDFKRVAGGFTGGLVHSAEPNSGAHAEGTSGLHHALG